MITLSLPWLIALVVLLFFVALVLMACYKSPMRKWFCFGLSAVTIAYLLYIIAFQQHDPALKFDWYIVAFVGITAALALSGVGFMDLVKPKFITMPSIAAEVANEDELLDSTKDDDEEEDNETKKREQMEIKVLSWFYSRLNKFTEEEQNAIKECTIVFVHDGTVKSPSVKIKNNSLYIQEELREICSALRLLEISREDLAIFVKCVFADTFEKTEESTLKDKWVGREKMQLLIDAYQEAENNLP